MVAQQAVMREWCLLGGGAATTMLNREEAAELLKNLTVADDGTIHHVLKRYRIVFQESSRLLGSPSGTLTVCCFYEPFIVVGNYLEERFRSSDFEIWKVLHNPRRWKNWSYEDLQKKNC
uniref:Uncharacterized protein n=1 Tax=Caenorhabditis japonica TaxID=281687 RepID=A0A8R1IWH5_CAEJA